MTQSILTTSDWCNNTMNANLFEAVRKGNTTEMQNLILLGANVNALSISRLSTGEMSIEQDRPIHLAVRFRHYPAIKTLIELGADLSIRDDFHRTPLQWATHLQDVEAIKILCNSDDDLEAQQDTMPEKSESSLETPLHTAVRSGNNTAIFTLLKSGANVNAEDSTQMTPLHWAAVRGNTLAIALLVAFGANLEARQNGRTPLDRAIDLNQIPSIKCLKLLGAKFDQQFKHSIQPKMNEITRKHPFGKHPFGISFSEIRRLAENNSNLEAIPGINGGMLRQWLST